MSDLQRLQDEVRFVVSMNATTGATSWAKSFGGTYNDQATDLAIDGAGNVVLTGYFAGTVNFGGGALSTGGNFDDRPGCSPR